MTRTRLRCPAALDVGLAVLLAVLSLLAVWDLISPDPAAETKLGYLYGSPHLLHLRVGGWLAAVSVELGVLPLHRRYPLAVLAVTLAAGTAHSFLLPATPAPADLAVAVAVYSVAGAWPRSVSAAVTAAGLLLAVGLDALVLSATEPGSGSAKGVITFPVKPASLAVPVLVLAAAWLAGESARSRRAYLAAVEQRAADAERDLGHQAQLAAAAERERITRELHDVIAHALSVMVIQAQGAGSALRRQQPAETGSALEAIITTGRSALAETRRLLGVARRPVGPDLPGHPAGPELAPQPGLADLSALIARVRGAGVPVELLVTGMVRPLDGGTELSAYRIIQEALTNTMKHGGPGAAASVAVHYAAAELTVAITDDGAGSVPAGPAGHGLAGMRARAAMLDGELTVGPRDGGGFGVHARLPLSLTESLPHPAGSVP